jgi:tungstate transport system ATP-binding protein
VDAILPLRMNQVSYAVAGKALVQGIDLTLTGSGLTAVLGPNGAGKSVLLRLCHGLLTPTSGDITWGGLRLERPAPWQAMVFHRPILLRRSAVANVRYVQSLRGVPWADRAALASRALERTGLAHLARAPARVLSAGEQQRLALARVWAVGPRVLFLDEPTANLDPGAARIIEALIGDIVADGTIVIMTTHDLAQARRLAHEVVFLSRGRVVETGPAAAFFGAPTSREAAAFIRGELTW